MATFTTIIPERESVSETSSNSYDEEDLVSDNLAMAAIVAPTYKTGRDLRGRITSLDMKELLSSTGLTKPVIDKIQSSISLYYQLFHLFGLRTPSSDKDEKSLEYIKSLEHGRGQFFDRIVYFCTMNRTNLDAFIDVFKYINAAFFSAHRGQVVPNKPEHWLGNNPKFIVGGVVGRWMLKLKKTNLPKFRELEHSVLMIKKGLPRPSKEALKKAEIKTTIHLTTVNPNTRDDTEILCPNDWEPTELNREALKKQFVRTVRELFMGGKPMTLDDLTEPTMPSSRSNCFGSVNSGGSITMIRQKYFDYLDSLEELYKTNLSFGVLSSEVTELFGKRGVDDQKFLDELLNVKEALKVDIDFSALKGAWRKLFWMMVRDAYDELPLVQALGLAEALKVRVISKGPFLLYQVLRPYQKYLWNRLKNNSVFELIGKTISPETIESALGSIMPDETIVSGDYKASTDNFHRWCSEAIANAIFDVLKIYDPIVGSDLMRDLFVRSLTRHEFWMHDSDGNLAYEWNGKHNHTCSKCFQKRNSSDFLNLEKKVDFRAQFCSENCFKEFSKPVYKKQEEGQLMGSVTSFPILCIGNAAICRWALELSNKKIYRLRDYARVKGASTVSNEIAPLRINGDDCVFKGGRSIYDLWKTISSYAGLEESLGKTYVSHGTEETPFAVMNSRLYEFKRQAWESDATPNWEEVKFVNFGLIFGMKRSSSSDDPTQAQCGPWELGMLHNELFDTCPSHVWKECSDLFIASNPCIRDYEIPWFLPTWLGGLGLKDTENKISHFNLAQASVIRMFLNRHDEDLSVQTISSEVQWKTHKWVNSQLKDFQFLEVSTYKVLDDVDIEKTYSQVYKLLTVCSLFDREEKNSFRGLTFDEVETKKDTFVRNVHKQLRHNQKVFKNTKKYLAENPSIKPMTIDELQFEKKPGYIPFTLIN